MEVIKKEMNKVLEKIYGKTVKQKQARIAYIFLAPCVIFFGITFIYPLIQAGILGFFRSSVGEPAKFVALEQYKKILHDSLFWYSMKNTLYFSVLSIPPTIILALAIALLLTSTTKVILRGFFRSIYFLPITCSFVAVAFVWQYLYQPDYGWINEILIKVGLSPQMWLNSTTQVLPSLAIVNIWMRTGFDMVIFIAGIESIPLEYYEAAVIDGASKFRRFKDITLPLLNPQILIVSVLEIINALKTFDLPFVATSGGPANSSRVAVMHIYDLAFKWNEIGAGSVAALFLFALIMGVTFLQWKIFRKPIEY
jgi:multiple sugar transport system permease protein